MYCPNCGTKLEDGVRFCPECGERIAAAPAPAQPAEQTAAALFHQPTKDTFAPAPAAQPKRETPAEPKRETPAEPKRETPVQQEETRAPGHLKGTLVGTPKAQPAETPSAPAPAQPAEAPSVPAPAQPAEEAFAAYTPLAQPVQPDQHAPVQPVQNAPVPPVQNAPVKPAKKQKDPQKKSKKKLWLIIGGAAAAVVIAAVLVLLLVILPEQKRVKRYNEGVTLLEEGKYDEAEEIFRSLGSYADSEELKAYADRGAAYEWAKAAMKRGDYEAALKKFKADPGFSDAQKLANECQARLDLAEAQSLYEQGEYNEALQILNEMYKVDVDGILTAETDALSEKCRRMLLLDDAKALFERGEYGQALEMIEQNALEDIEGATEIANECKRQLGYAAIVNMMNEGAYREALDLLTSDVGEGMEDRNARITECRNRIDYEDAEKALKNGHNYDAYVKFSALGSFLDAADRAKKCIVSRPETGETYHNGSYKSSAVSLAIKPPSDGTDNYLKLYILEDGKETLVLSAYFRSGEKITVKMPEGTYRIKVAYSDGDWFGETDMFGDKGVYQRLKIDGADSFKLTKGSWELTLRQNVQNGNVGTSSENRNNF